MSARLAVTCMCAALAMGAARVACAQAQEKHADALDLTMKLLPEHAKGPEEITKRIELPRPAAAGEHKDDRPNADNNDAEHKDDKGPPADPGEKGRENAEQARERGREFGQEVAEQARENRENAGHGAAGNGNGGGNGGGKGH